jgi:hypothetical protein
LENESASQNKFFHVVCSAKGNSNEGQYLKKEIGKAPLNAVSESSISLSNALLQN